MATATAAAAAAATAGAAALRSSSSAVAMASCSSALTCVNDQRWISEPSDGIGAVMRGSMRHQWLHLRAGQGGVQGAGCNYPSLSGGSGSSRWLVTRVLSSSSRSSSASSGSVSSSNLPRPTLGSKRKVILSFTYPTRPGGEADQARCHCIGIARRAVAKRSSARSSGGGGGAPAAGSEGGSGGGAYVSHSQQRANVDVDNGENAGAGVGEEEEETWEELVEEAPADRQDGNRLVSGRSQNGSQPLGWEPDVEAKDEFKGWLDEDAKGARRRITAKGIVLFTGSVLLAAGVAIASYTMYRRGTYFTFGRGSAGDTSFSVPSAGIAPPATSTTTPVPVPVPALEEASPAESSPSVPAPEPAVPPRVLVPAVVDLIQGQAFEALQVLKVIDSDAEPGGICTRREYARWLINASSVLNRQPEYRVLPAMFIEGMSSLAFDDVLPDDPDFPHIQGLAEAGIISSKLSREDLGCDREAQQLGCGSAGTGFHPDRPLTREDLINWKMGLENRSLPLPDKQVLRENWGFMDSAKVSKDALPAVVKDLSLGRQSAITAAFGYTKRFEPHKPVTRAQVAAALATGELAEVVAEEVARLEADKVAAAAVQAAALVDALAESEAARKFAQDLEVERHAREELKLSVTAAQEEAERVKSEFEEERLKVEDERLAVLVEKQNVESVKEEVRRAKEEAEEYLSDVLSSRKAVESEKGWLQREMERAGAEREVFEKARVEADEERQAAVAARKEAEAEKQSLAAARSVAESEAKKAKEAARKLEALKKRLQEQGRTVVVDKLEVVEVPTVTQRNLDIGSDLKENEPESEEATLGPEQIKRKLSGALERLDDRRTELVDTVKQRVGNAAKTTGQRVSDVRKAAGDAVRGTVQSVGSAVSDAQHKLADGTKRIAGEWKDGASKLAGRLKGA